MYPRYHSNCVPQKDATSGSNKPYALTRQSRERSTYRNVFKSPARKGWDIEEICRRGPTDPRLSVRQRASSVFVVAFLIHLLDILSLFPRIVKRQKGKILLEIFRAASGGRETTNLTFSPGAPRPRTPGHFLYEQKVTKKSLKGAKPP